MARSSKSLATLVKQGLRRVFGPPMRGLSKSGRIVQTLWDAAQIQNQQRDYQRKIGEIAMKLVTDGQLRDVHIEKLMARMKRNDHLLKRLEAFLEHQVRNVKPTLDETDEPPELLLEEKLQTDPNDDRLAPV